MKKIKYLSLLLACSLSLGVVGCSSASSSNGTTTEKTETSTDSNADANTESATHLIKVPNAEGELIEVEFPKDPQRVVVLNNQTLDFLDAVGLGDRIVGMTKSASTPEHLQKYVDDENIVNLGSSMKDPNMEAIMSLQPDVIFSSDRTRAMYNEFSRIAPTFAAYVTYADGFMESYETLANTHAQIFGVEGDIAATIDSYNERIAAIAEFAEGKTALLGIFAGGLNTLGNVGRASLVVNEMGFENLAGGEDVNHGNVSSYEAWLALDPEYMFVLDKDTAVGTEAVSAKEQLEVNNPVIAQTQAFKNGRIIYLEPGSAWYVADGGITALDLMISGIEEGLGLTTDKVYN